MDNFDSIFCSVFDKQIIQANFLHNKKQNLQKGFPLAHTRERYSSLRQRVINTNYNYHRKNMEVKTFYTYFCNLVGRSLFSCFVISRYVYHSDNLVPPFTSITPLAVLRHCLWCGLLATQSITGSINTALQDAPISVTIAKFSTTNLHTFRNDSSKDPQQLLTAHCMVYQNSNWVNHYTDSFKPQTTLCTTINYAAISFGHPNKCIILPAFHSLIPQPCLGVPCRGQR